MMLMCGQSNQMWHWAAGKYPGRVGMLLGPSYCKKQAIRFWMPYALDNDAFSAWSKKQTWDVGAWREMLVWAKQSGQAPLWVLVPDVVADRDETLQSWKTYAEEASGYGWPLAFAVQDGMTASDVPPSADLIFIGGTTRWKWKSLPMWTRTFKRVHVGRVNELRRLWTCEDFGVESVDGSGWFRATDGGRQARQLLMWLENQRNETIEMDLG